MSSKSKKVASQQRPKTDIVDNDTTAEKVQRTVKNNPPYELFAKLQLRREQLIGELQMVEQQMNNVRTQIQKVLVENRSNG